MNRSPAIQSESLLSGSRVAVLCSKLNPPFRAAKTDHTATERRSSAARITVLVLSQLSSPPEGQEVSRDIIEHRSQALANVLTQCLSSSTNPQRVESKARPAD